MKKVIALASILALTGCSAYHTGRIGVDAPSNAKMDIVPKEARVAVDTTNKLTGTAECSSFLWAFTSAPERQTYGIPVQANEGNFAPTDCVAAAVYDAMKNTDADAMYGMQYTAVKKGLLCFGSRCLYGNTKVIVKGFPGKITSITDKGHNITEKDKK